MSAKIQMTCEKCQNNEHWDNRVGKTNPKAPDFRCTACKNGVWLPKNGTVAAPVAQAPVQQGGYLGQHVPAIDGPYAPPAPSVPDVPFPPAQPTDLYTPYKQITDWVMREIAPVYKHYQIGLSPEAAAAIVATIYIQQQKRVV